MKLIIDIDESNIQEIADYRKGEHQGQLRYEIVSNAFKAIANGIPYETRGDMIRREALKDEVRKHAKYYADKTKEDRYNAGYTECACEVLDFIDNAPTVEPRIEYGTDGQPYKLSMTNGKEYERPKGEWVISGFDYKCSNCGMLPYFRQYNFCPNCGADMRKGGAE